MGHIERVVGRVFNAVGLQRGERTAATPLLERYTGKVALVGGDTISNSEKILQVHAEQTASKLGRAASGDVEVVRVQALVAETADSIFPGTAEKSAERLADALDAHGGFAVDYHPEPAKLEMGPEHVENGHEVLEKSLQEFRAADEAQGGPQMYVGVVNPTAGGYAFEHVHESTLVGGQTLLLRTARDDPAKALWTPVR